MMDYKLPEPQNSMAEKAQVIMMSVFAIDEMIDQINATDECLVEDFNLLKSKINWRMREGLKAELFELMDDCSNFIAKIIVEKTEELNKE